MKYCGAIFAAAKTQFFHLSFWVYLKDVMSQGIIALKNEWGWTVCTISWIYNTCNTANVYIEMK